ncbi:LysR family transcriptional regulator [Pedobacter sp. G11]|nr:LysR family transcriptional regulator [Pedobacter sp. G11]
MNTNDLKIFEAVAASGSFTKAASATFTVQSNVTARIKSLEEELGVELFKRNSRKVALTNPGEQFMHYARQIQKLVNEAKSNLASSGAVSGSLRVGCIETTMALKVPEILQNFEAQYPDVELEFRSEMRSALIRDVLSYELDAAFVSAPVNINGLDQLSIKEEQLVIITSSNGRGLSSILKRDPLKIVVFGEGCVFRARLEAYLTSKGVIHYKTIVLNSIEGIINFVEAGMGISLLPQEVISGYYPTRAISSHGLSRQLGTMNTVLIFRKEQIRSRALEAFIDLYRLNK